MPEQPNYTEDTVAIFIEHYLTLLSWPFPHFSLVLFSKRKERVLGADARLTLSSIKAFKPFYMQFKRPFGYFAWDRNGRRNYRAKIIQERSASGLAIEPVVLAFHLRDKRPQQRDLQHNVLFRLRQLLLRLNVGDAVYVCPLFLDRTAYSHAIHRAGLWLWPWYWWHYWRRLSPPWKWIEEKINDANSLKPLIEEIPVLDEHVVIPPHTRVKSSKHWYSFTDRGEDVCFHSPERLFEYGTRLSLWLEELSRGLVEPAREGGFLDLAESNRVLRELVGAMDVDFRMESEGWVAWMEWGDFLERNYQIMQYVLLIRE